ncbi:homoserine kinase [candidate division KSB1 bacterium]|nr:homoserine kinase [candidate division KSB1 bacterium]
MMPLTIRVQVPGSTSNLGAGFDALGLAVDLPLQVVFHFEVASTRVLAARGEGAHEISQLEDHLILHAFQRACEELRQAAPAVGLEINNSIPLKRGLGSSGAAIVAGLLAASVYFDNALSQQQLLKLANELEGHPENAAASLLGGLTVNGVQNEEVLSARFAPPGNWKAACFVPELEIATEDARRVLPASLSRAHAIGNLQSAAMMVAAFAKQNPALLEFAARDYLHQPFRKVLIPGFDDILMAAMRAGGYGAFLSGSGSTMLAIAEEARAEGVSRAMAKAAQSHGLSGRPMMLSFAQQGAVCEVTT